MASAKETILQTFRMDPDRKRWARKWVRELHQACTVGYFTSDELDCLLSYMQDLMHGLGLDSVRTVYRRYTAAEMVEALMEAAYEEV